MKAIDPRDLASAQPWEVPAEWRTPIQASFRLLDPSALDERDQAQWDRLGAGAATTNVFAAPWFMRASLAHCAGNGDAQLAVVSDQAGEWIGMLPVAKASRYGRVPFPHWAAWHHPNMFEGTPLVLPGHAGVFWDALLAGLAKVSPGRKALRVFDLPLDDPTNAELFEMARASGRALKTDRQYARASLGSVRTPLTSDRRRRLEGLWRKLEREHGKPNVAVHREIATMCQAAASFVKLEGAGWKGAAGSALDCADDTRTFFAEVCRVGAERGSFELATLSVGEHALAIVTAFIHRGRGFGFKMAFDEAFSTYAPGVLLLDRLTDRWAALPLSGFDSCCAPGQQPIERLWPDRREMIDCGISLGGPFGQYGLRLLDFVDRVRQPKQA